MKNNDCPFSLPMTGGGARWCIRAGELCKEKRFKKCKAHKEGARDAW